MKTIREQLAAPFDIHEVKWKPQAIKDGTGKAVMVCFVDARVVMERLDEVFGPDGWSTSYRVVGNSSVECTLSVRFPDTNTWVSKADVGGESDQKDDTDRMKSAYSDALKRAAVQFGIGRYLYRAGIVWVDYDEQRRRCALTNEQLTKKYLNSRFGTKQSEFSTKQLEGEGGAEVPPANAPKKVDSSQRRAACLKFLTENHLVDLVLGSRDIFTLSEEEYEQIAKEARKLAAKPAV